MIKKHSPFILGLLIGFLLFVALMFVTVPLVAQVQRYFQLVTTDTSVNSLIVGGGIKAGTSGNQIVDAAGAIVGLPPVRTWVQWRPAQATLPSNIPYANFDTHNNHPILVYPDGSDTSAFFEGTMPEEWDGTSLTVEVFWVTPSTSGSVVFGAAFEALALNGHSIDSDNFATEVLASAVAANGTSDVQKVSSVILSTAGNRDNVAAGDFFRIRLRRLASNGSDNLGDDVQVLGVQLRKT